MADLGGPGARPPTAQNFLDFMQLFGNFDKIVCWRPPPPRGSAPSPTGNPGSAPAVVPQKKPKNNTEKQKSKK